jgi:predicted nuclease of restriction endonuclease-like RecB superfamily
MLTGKLLRIRYARDRIIPCYLNVTDPTWQEVAERLLELFRSQEGRTRGALEEDLKETFGSDPGQAVHQGLAKLLEDRCEFEVVSGHPPEKLRDLVFSAAADRRRGDNEDLPCPAQQAFDRNAILQDVAARLEMTPDAVDQGMFADLKSEQRLVRFKDTTAERLLQRYNVALAQAVLLRSTRVHAYIRNEPAQRYRQLFRLVKFHRLVCEVEATGPDAYCLHLDGPLSLFSATQKYGLQLALFLPALLLCQDFDLRAELRWGPQRKSKTFTLSAGDGLVSHYPDTGMYVPPELAMFAELFRKKITDWDIYEETGLTPLGDGFWVPDYRLVHRATGRAVFLEVLGFWRRSSVQKHLERLRQFAREPFLLAVSDLLRVEDAELEGLPSGVHRFRQMPLPDEIVRLANDLLLDHAS